MRRFLYASLLLLAALALTGCGSKGPLVKPAATAPTSAASAAIPPTN